MTSVAPSGDWWRLAARTVWVPTAAEMASLDRRAIERSIPERALIENAGRALALRLHARWPEGPVVALAGSGHNGADALVALRTLHAWGREVVAIRCGAAAPDPPVLDGWDILLEPPDTIDSALSRAAVAIDGILGTGLSSAPREAQAQLIGRLNASDCKVVACDGPSGIDFTTGAVPGEAVEADLTVTFGWPKIGMLRFPARGLCGEIETVEIGFPPPAPTPRARLITAAWAAALLGRRGDDAHKGLAGYVTLVGGQAGMAGAIVLAARAAIRGGAGVVRVVSAPANRDIIQAAVPAAVYVAWDDGDAVAEAVRSSSAVGIGPGLGTDDGRRELVASCLAAVEGAACVLDADALNIWGGDLEALGNALPPETALTPHPGEMGRLLGRDTRDVTGDPLATAGELAARTEAVVVLKGAPTVVAEPAGGLRVSSIVSPGLAAGGMGDVLTGLIAAHAAGGLSPADAAATALMVSGLATVFSSAPVGQSAEDVPDRLPAARVALDTVEPGRTPGVVVALPAARADVS